jgi:hypothetical protein
MRKSGSTGGLPDNGHELARTRTCQQAFRRYTGAHVKYWTQIGLPLLLMVVFALSRWPGVMPDNFSAVYALVFCAGVYLPRKLAWWLPMVVMLVTDLALNLHYRALYEANPGPYEAPMEFFNPYLLANYLVYGALVWLGSRFKPTAHWLKLIGGGVLGALVFYLLSNTASWLQLPGYAKTLAGWWQALTVGLPGWAPTWTFLLKTLASGGLFTGLFVGAMKLATREAEVPEPRVDEEPAEPDGAQPEESKA